MSAANYEPCIDAVFREEGGYSAVRADPGNWTGGKVGVGVLKGTNYGIAASAYPTLDIKNLTLDQAKAIYRRDYWNKIDGDNLPPGIDLALFDFAVNSGPTRAARYLQGILVVQQDGVIGPQTVHAAMSSNAVSVVTDLCSVRLTFLKGLPTFATFGKGWTARVARIRSKALLMAGHPNPEPVPLPAVPTPKTDAQPVQLSLWDRILNWFK